jgi:hypothetical protein
MNKFLSLAIMTTLVIAGFAVTYIPVNVNAQCKTVTGPAGSVNQCTGAISTPTANIAACVGHVRTLTANGHTLNQAC